MKNPRQKKPDLPVWSLAFAYIVLCTILLMELADLPPSGALLLSSISCCLFLLLC